MLKMGALERFKDRSDDDAHNELGPNPESSHAAPAGTFRDLSFWVTASSTAPPSEDEHPHFLHVPLNVMKKHGVQDPSLGGYKPPVPKQLNGMRSIHVKVPTGTLNGGTRFGGARTWDRAHFKERRMVFRPKTLHKIRATSLNL